MRLTILTFGSTGDVRPMVALGAGLRRAGVEVTLATDAAFAPLAQTHGLAFAPIAGDIRATLHTEDGRRALDAGANPLRMARLIRAHVRPQLDRLITDATAAVEGADALLLGGTGYYPGSILADAFRLPFALAYLAPMLPTARLPSPMLPLPRDPERQGTLRGLRNRAGYALAGQAFWQMLRPLINEVRRGRFGLRPWPLWGNFGALARGRVLQLHGFSPTLVPPAPEWPAFAPVTGDWPLIEEYTPPPALDAWLAAGEPPVCVGFGSMAAADPAALTRSVVDAVRITGRRVLLLRGWGALDDLPSGDDLFVLDHAPHAWLYPRCAAVVHHGGAGTTHAALRAGRAAVVVPFFGDQPFWGRRVAALGAGPQPIPLRELNAARLSAALGQALAPAMQARAAALGAQLAQEDGVGTAVRLVNGWRAAYSVLREQL